MLEPFRDPALSVDERVDDLLPRLTVTEKVAELNQSMLGWQTWRREGGGFATTDRLERELDRRGGVGAIYGLQRADAWSGNTWTNGGLDPAAAVDAVATVQARIVERSRFGIPALMVEEAPHGHQALGSQLMPTNLGVAATWQPDLLEAAAAHVARELRARGAHIALVSGLDMLRDPRWGRGEECFGEDALLASAFVRAFVRGFRSGGVVALLKHFAGQGAGIGGRNGSGAPIGPRELREVHLPAARAGIEEGALGVMAAYNDLDGVPCCANEELLTGVLREQWGFEGIVMADMGAIDRLIPAAGSELGAGILALRAGVDLSLCDHAYRDLDTAVERGELDEALVDRAARRVLGLKIRLGLLDPPAALPSFPAPDPQPRLAAAIPVLLKNDGLLPLAQTPARIAVIGPNGDDVDSMLGDYVPPLLPGTGTTVAAGLRELAPDADVRIERGCDVTAPIEGGLERATRLAAESDLVVLVLGGTSERGYDDAFEDNGAAAGAAIATSGEGFDLRDVTLPAPQVALAEAVAAAGTPVVLVVIAGRPHGIGAAAANADAVLHAWYPGPEGGRAIAELLLGHRDPVGRLAASIPASSDQLPVAYDERMEHSPRYVDGPAEPEYPFGFGLSLTEWELGGAALSGAWPELTVTADLTNLGPRDGEQLVQLYARAWAPGMTPRKAVLLGWSRVTLSAGASGRIAVTVDADALPHLGDPGAGHLELWLSITGAGEPVESLRVDL